MEDPIEMNIVNDTEDLKAIFGEHFTVHGGWMKDSNTSWKRQAVYSIASVWNHTKNVTGMMHAWDEVIPGLYIGMQPTARTGHPLLELKVDEKGWTALNVAVIENHALVGSFSGSVLGTITIDKYKEQNIRHHWLNTPDHSTEMQAELVIDTILLMCKFHKLGLPIYVHCKTGHGRSATIVVGFLTLLFLTKDKVLFGELNKFDKKGELGKEFAKLKKETNNIKAIINFLIKYLRTLRDTEVVEVRFNKLVGIFKELAPKLTKGGDLIVERSAEYQFLVELGQSDAFKELSVYFSTTEGRFSKEAKLVQGLINDMIENKKEWYLNIFSMHDHLPAEVEIRLLNFQQTICKLLSEEPYKSCRLAKSCGLGEEDVAECYMGGNGRK